MADRPYSNTEIAEVRLDLQIFSYEYDYGYEDVAQPETESGDNNEHGGADFRIYRIEKPIDYLRQQKNIHRPEITPNYKGESVLNVLRDLWENIYNHSRSAWQRILSLAARKSATEQYPELSQGNATPRAELYRFERRFDPIAGYEVIKEFRFPVLKAPFIKPPVDVKLEGSSSNFLAPKKGDVYVPLGKLPPGLFLVEAAYGDQVAYTLVFVSSTVLITKTSAGETFVWAADSTKGTPKGNVTVYLTDQISLLEKGITDKEGVFVISRPSLEHSFLLAEDADGGIAISENFYYDSEIYGQKNFITTERPLYQPGDEVQVRIFTRIFQDAIQSKGLSQDQPYEMKVLDSGGKEIFNQPVTLNAANHGGYASFFLPDQAIPGGYTIKLVGDTTYTGSFRVRKYTKPHFDLSLVFNKNTYTIGEVVEGQIELKYPHGEAVPNAKVRVIVLSEPYAMAHGQVMGASGEQTQIFDKAFTTNSKGTVPLSLPASAEPRRYIIRVLANDASLAKVSATRELIIQGSKFLYELVSAKKLSAPKENVQFEIKSETPETGASVLTWRALKLEDRSETTGTVTTTKFGIAFSAPGTYQLSVLDDKSQPVAQISHWVSGTGVKNLSAVDIITAKDSYKSDDTAEFMVLFADEVQDALITLERDRVHDHATLASPREWLVVEKVAEKQYRVSIPLKDFFAPNIVLSVLYVKDGQYYFEHKGIQVAMEELEIKVTPSAYSLKPRDPVELKIETTLQGKPISAMVSLGVVDEMVYVLQPEIAPAMTEFFYHPRRNQVRTWASLDFHTYNLAITGELAEEGRSSDAQTRPLKLRERPRRDDKDTAAYFPAIQTAENGQATVSLKLPDAVTRWRITAKGMTVAGRVGQSVRYLETYQEMYLKWTSSKYYREGDKPNLSLMLFNQTGEQHEGKISVSGGSTGGGDFTYEKNITLPPGATPILIPWEAKKSQRLVAKLQAGAFGDHLETAVAVRPLFWIFQRGELQNIVNGKNSVAPKQPFENLKVTITDNIWEGLTHVSDALIEYPYGCVEQLTSRLIPLSLVHANLARLGEGSKPSQKKLRRNLATARARLYNLANPSGNYGWWGDGWGDSVLWTAYAFLGLKVSAENLDINLPDDEFASLQELYRTKVTTLSPDADALVIWMMDRLGLPVQNILEGLAEKIMLESANAGEKTTAVAVAVALADRDFDSGIVAKPTKFAALVLDTIARKPDTILPKNWSATVDNIAKEILKNPLGEEALLVSAAVMRNQLRKKSVPDEVSLMQNLLGRTAHDPATFDRALALLFLAQKLPTDKTSKSPDYEFGPEWKLEKSLVHSYYHLKPGRDTASFNVQHLSEPKSGPQVHIWYDSIIPPQERLDATIIRNLYVMDEPDKAGINQFEKISGESWDIAADRLYVDELQVQISVPLNFALLEVPLPVGAEVEKTTWGIKLPEYQFNESMEPPVEPPTDSTGITFLDLADYQTEEMDMGYAIPVGKIEGPRTFYRLIRFSGTGDYQIPSARLTSMYRSGVAFEANKDEKAVTTIHVH